jgi:RimJ/RimL family protein N-acetyltransferase
MLDFLPPVNGWAFVSFYCNTYIEPKPDRQSCTFGLWLRKNYWGQNIHGKVTDIRVHLSFELLDFIYINVGCLDDNIKSLKAITRSIKRYNGNYYGTPPKISNNYSDYCNERIVPHHEFYISLEDYKSEETGITSSIPGVLWSDTEAYNRVNDF